MNKVAFGKQEQMQNRRESFAGGLFNFISEGDGNGKEIDGY